MATRFVDSLITYRILMLLTTPFVETDAYKLGIIDAKGKELKRMSQLNTVAERDAYTLLHRLVFRLKRIIEKVPLENKKLLSFAAALALIKEQWEAKKEPINLENLYMNRLGEDLNDELILVEMYFSKTTLKPFRFFYEDVPANNAASTPGIAGFTPETMGVKKSKQTLYKRGNITNAKSVFKLRKKILGQIS